MTEDTVRRAETPVLNTRVWKQNTHTQTNCIVLDRRSLTEGESPPLEDQTTLTNQTQNQPDAETGKKAEC